MSDRERSLLPLHLPVPLRRAVSSGERQQQLWTSGAVAKGSGCGSSPFPSSAALL
jgi:hypothetical protein